MRTTISVNKATKTASLVIALDAGEPNQPFRIDWDDGSAIQTVASGAHAGPTTHVYAKTGGYSVAVQGNDLRTTERVYVPDFLKAYDPEKFEKTPQELRQVERDKAAQILGQRANVG